MSGSLAAACDQAVPNEGPVPRGEINNDTLQIPPVDTLGGPLGGNDIAPPNCEFNGCAQPINGCYSSYCNTSTGYCETTYNDGYACDDGNLCTINDACYQGNCQGTGRICPAIDQCHDAGACSPQTGTCFYPVKADNTACNDNNPCTQSDTCQSGVCTGGSPRQCPPTDQCHDAGTCSATTGGCSNPVKANNTRLQRSATPAR